ncbi:hypothetical protein GCM10007298_44150 [Williamsia phyllosphaerae]|uniref:Uncharacterized protein n=1 Tax=Williamsia phyllosphaerae TaxID=885042 RepID=A0ABQ1VAG6_9NOCA|nr:hypothetical protein GCM10007298_44150 [Williamsia phyllosphaerae]
MLRTTSPERTLTNVIASGRRTPTAAIPDVPMTTPSGSLPTSITRPAGVTVGAGATAGSAATGVDDDDDAGASPESESVEQPATNTTDRATAVVATRDLMTPVCLHRRSPERHFSHPHPA